MQKFTIINRVLQVFLITIAAIASIATIKHAEVAPTITPQIEVTIAPSPAAPISPGMDVESKSNQDSLDLSATLKISAVDLIKRSDDLMRGNTNSGLYSMKIVTPSWQRELKLHVYSSGRDKVFIRIISPAKEAGITTLRIKNEMWNYIPSVEKVLKIPPSLMLEPWMGSDFANDDLVKESSIVHDYTHKITAQEKINNDPVYKVELTPKPSAPVIWGKIIRWIRKIDAVPLREEYYNERGKLIKALEYSNIGKVSDRIIPKTWKMTSMIKPGHSTTIELLDVEYNKTIKENIFTLTNLKRFQ